MAVKSFSPEANSLGVGDHNAVRLSFLRHIAQHIQTVVVVGVDDRHRFGAHLLVDDAVHQETAVVFLYTGGRKVVRTYAGEVDQTGGGGNLHGLVFFINGGGCHAAGAGEIADGGKDGLVLANQAGNLRCFLGIILGVKALQDDLLAVDAAGLVDFVGCHLRTDVKVDTVFCAVTRNRADDRQGNGIFRTACCCICRIAVCTAASQRTGTKRSRQQGTKLFFHGFASPLNFELLWLKPLAPLRFSMHLL